jgi:low temperature requirement protein LtrA
MAVSTVESEKRVTWAELFFDLVFVFAITRVSVLLHDDHSGRGLVQAAVVFVPVYWAWVGTTIHANTHDVDTPLDRLGVFAIGLGSLLMAFAVSDAYRDRGVLFGTGYLLTRLILAALVFRTTAFRQIPVNSFSVGVCVSGPLLLAGGLVHGNVRVALWACAAAVDLLTPRLLRSRLARIRFEPAHLPERFGLFLIIAMGESVVAIGAAAVQQPIGAARLTAVGLAYALVCALWWVYFHFAASAVRYAVRTAAVQTEVVRTVLSYGHLVFIGAIIAVAVGLNEVVAHPTDHLHADVAALLVGGCALYLATFGYTRWRMFRLISWTRLGAGAVCLAMLPFATTPPALVTVGALAVVVAALNVLEAVRVIRAPQVAAAEEAERARLAQPATE